MARSHLIAYRNYMPVMETIELWLRGGLFLSLLLLLLLAESLWPRRGREQKRLTRWRTNFGISILNTIAIKLMGPITAIACAVYASSQQWGLLNQFGLPYWADFILAVLILDLMIYAQHVATHKIPILWKLHKVHHADRDFDTSTALRFHTIEIVLSMLYKCALVFLIGPAAFAVLIFEVLLNSSAMFNHANLRLPQWFDRILRIIVVTPDMHRVHHSVHADETNSNYGFFLPWWDWVFKTYTQQPKDGHADMTIGLPQYQTEQPAKFLWTLKLPFQ